MKLAITLFIILLLIFSYIASVKAEDIDWDKLVASIIQVESGGNHNAYNKSSGCIGLMQINPNGALKEWNMLKSPPPVYQSSTAIWHIEPHWKKSALYDPDINKAIGLWYLKRLYDHYGCKTVEHIAAAYNGGITRLRKYNYDINKMPRETREYVKKVMTLYNKEK